MARRQVSGDGQLPIEASAPANSGPTGYDGLDIYLVSAQTNTNMTVSNHSDILKQEPGSTVKHLNWPIPSCISAGQYNVCASIVVNFRSLTCHCAIVDTLRVCSYQRHILLHHYTRPRPDRQ